MKLDDIIKAAKEADFKTLKEMGFFSFDISLRDNSIKVMGRAKDTGEARDIFLSGFCATDDWEGEENTYTTFIKDDVKVTISKEKNDGNR